MTVPARRRTFLIDKKFQLKFSLFVCSWMAALSLLYPLIIYSLFDFFIRFVEKFALPEKIASLHMLRKDVVVSLVIVQSIFIGITFLFCLFTSHKIAGPIFRLRKAMKELRNGNRTIHVTFRESDHFKKSW